MNALNFITGAVPTALAGGSNTTEMNSLAWYIFGALIALLLLAYLIYSLIKPEKF